MNALALVFLVFFATFAACTAFVAIDFHTEEQRVDLIQSPSTILVGNRTIITPNEPIDTPGGPT